VLPGRELLGRQAVEVPADGQRHDPHLGRSHLGGAQLLGDCQRRCELGFRVLDRCRRDDVRRVADAGEPEAPAMQLVGDLVRQACPVGAVEHSHVHRTGISRRRWMRRLHAGDVAGPQRRGVVAAERLPAEPAHDGESDEEEQQPPPAATPPGLSPGRQVASSEHRHADRA